MYRGLTGEFKIKKSGGEEVRSFIPFPLAPRPTLNIDSELRDRLDAALIELGRLDGVAALLPDLSLFLYSYVRKEAVLSSQIEGTQSSLSDLLLFELEEFPGIPLDDVVEVSNYVRALTYGLARLRDLPLSNRLIREVHEILLRRGRGSEKEPGEFRRSQNWIGGTKPGNAFYVPPPEDLVPDLMSSLEKFLNDIPDKSPTLIKAALAHVQFESIHPFLDGNGRVGRLLIPMILCRDGILKEPLLYMSLYFRRRRTEYFDLLTKTRLEGDWEAWLRFFTEGVYEISKEASAAAGRLAAIGAEDRRKLESLGRMSSSALRLHQALQRRPLESIPSLSRECNLSVPAVTRAIESLQKAGIIKEITGKKRGRLFLYVRYMDVLGAGTET
ncbi:MAG: Fic family protein [Candidatus Aminicenantes bacterium]|nr:Fic family protein [Candidatus Aminicenantes bacterium]